VAAVANARPSAEECGSRKAAGESTPAHEPVIASDRASGQQVGQPYQAPSRTRTSISAGWGFDGVPSSSWPFTVAYSSPFAGSTASPNGLRAPRATTRRSRPSGRTERMAALSRLRSEHMSQVEPLPNTSRPFITTTLSCWWRP
jgi:hypothetical protein